MNIFIQNKRLLIILIFLLFFAFLAYQFFIFNAVNSNYKNSLLAYNTLLENFTIEKLARYNYFESKTLVLSDSFLFIIPFESVSIYEINSFEINKQIDLNFNDTAKYFLKVNPLDPFVIKANSHVKKGEDIKWEIFNYVKHNVRYRRDINWNVDQVNSPAVTLSSGLGDCEDISIVLASMFMNVGVENVQLCFADITKDNQEKFNHLFVAVDNIAWDATNQVTGSIESSISKEIEEWYYECYEINGYLEKIE